MSELLLGTENTDAEPTIAEVKKIVGFWQG